MRNFLLVCLLALFANSGVAQNAPIDFETGGNGASWTWSTFENDDNPALEIVANPSQAAPNASATVAKFTARAAGNPWAGCESMHGADIGAFTLDASTSTIKIMVYKPVISDVGIKLVDSAGGALPELKVANTKINEWEELTFDFSSREGIKYDQIVVFPDFQSRASDNICYFDNITFGPAAATPEPTTAAADPTYPATDVISLFSGVYTDVAVDTWRTSWSNAVLTDVQVAGNDVKKYAALDFVGIEATGANMIDATDMTHFNLDMWTHNATTFRVKLVDFGADGVAGGGDDSEHEIVINNPNQEEWVSLNLALADFTNLTATDHIGQIILSALPTGSVTVYIDNVFFSKGSPLAEPTTAAADPTADAANVISIFSNVYTDVTVDTYKTSWSVANLTQMQVAGNDVLQYSAMDYVGIEATGANIIDASDMDHINLDMWTPNSTVFKIKLVDFGADGAFGGGDDTEHEITINNPNQEEWVNVSLPLTDFTGLGATSNIAQIVMVSEPTGTSVVYIDNLYFSKTPGTSVNDIATLDVFEVYPNPSNGIVNLDVAANEGLILNYTISNIKGQVVAQESVNEPRLNKVINTTVFTPGVYMLNVVTEQGTITKKLIIQ